MNKKTSVVLMALLLVLSLVLCGCPGRDDAGVNNLNDDLYNDSNDLGNDLDDIGRDAVDGAERIGEDIKDGTEDILDGNDMNNHDGIVNDHKDSSEGNKQ